MITIPWANFGIVVATVLVGTVVLTAFCSGGVRLLETAGPTGAGAVKRVAAYACFAVCAAAVLFGLWVIVPQFH